MAVQLRFSEHPLSQKWLAQFRTSKDRAVAAQLLNQLKRVSAREFETAIEQSLTGLQKRLNATIAVYPIAPPMPGEIAGYHPFNGGIPKDVDSQSRQTGRRRKYGSEDRVGHVLARLQDRFKHGAGASSIECAPTLAQLKTQGIRHIVLVDDVCGSGKRITDYWNVIPRRIKSLLSLKRCELWIVLYAITPAGRMALKQAMPNFPIRDHLIVRLPGANLQTFLTPELSNLCTNYAESIGMTSSGLGYRGTACPIVFEHGCPNNLPAILWSNQRRWKGLFPNLAIPTELRPWFDEDGTERALEALWRANQPKLALSLMEALDHAAPLDDDQCLLLTLLGLRLRGVAESGLANRLLMGSTECAGLLGRAAEMGLYAQTSSQVTPLGKELVARFRERSGRVRRPLLVDTSPADYYPSQCEGKLLKPGKTARGNGRAVPMESP
jgi:hypothetical protein